MKPMDIIFLGALFVVAGGIIGAIGTRKQNRASSIKSDKQLEKIQELNEQNTKLSSSLADLSSQNSRLSENLSELSKQNSKLIEELRIARNEVGSAREESYNNTFGSNGGICVLGETYLKLYNESELPMYDVKLFITRYDELLKCERSQDKYGETAIKASCYNSLTKQYSTSIIYGNTVVDFTDFPISQQHDFKILIKIITKKGTYYQQLINSEKLGTAYRILIEENEGEYWKQFINKDPEHPFQLKSKIFKTVKEKSLRVDPVDWNKEFPLPVSFSLIN
jgi:hypothetical protein